MKKWIFMAAAALLSVAAATSCRNDNDYSVGQFVVAWGTVRWDDLANPTITRDNGSILHVVNSRVPFSMFIPGQRVIVNYSPLSDDGGNPRNVNVSVNSLYQVLTKGLVLQSFIDLDPVVREDSLGSDPIDATRMWFGSHFLNVQFNAWFGGTVQHMISMVHDDVTPGDTVRLYLRHNAFDDPRHFVDANYVSFDIASVLPAGQTSVPVKVTWTGYDGVTRSNRGTFSPAQSGGAPTYDPHGGTTPRVR